MSLQEWFVRTWLCIDTKDIPVGYAEAKDIGVDLKKWTKRAVWQSGFE
jgi:hypothetical protein